MEKWGNVLTGPISTPARACSTQNPRCSCEAVATCRETASGEPGSAAAAAKGCSASLGGARTRLRQSTRCSSAAAQLGSRARNASPSAPMACRLAVVAPPAGGAAPPTTGHVPAVEPLPPPPPNPTGHDITVGAGAVQQLCALCAAAAGRAAIIVAITQDPPSHALLRDSPPPPLLQLQGSRGCGFGHPQPGCRAAPA